MDLNNPWNTPEALLIAYLDGIPEENRTPSEERQLRLLLDLRTRYSAMAIIYLEDKKDKTPDEERQFELLLNPLINYRDTTTKILMLENKLSGTGDISDNELQQLNDFYMKLILKEPTDTQSTQEYLTSICMKKGIQNQLDSFSCSSDYHSASREDGGYSPTFFPSNFRRKAAIKTIEQHITSSATKLVDYYLHCQAVSASYRTSKTMKDYIETKIKYLTFYLKKYFTHSSTPDFSQDALEALYQSLAEKISSRELTLSNKEVLLHLNRYITPTTPTHSSMLGTSSA